MSTMKQFPINRRVRIGAGLSLVHAQICCHFTVLETCGMAWCSFVLASSFRTMAGFLCSLTQVRLVKSDFSRVKMAFLRDYLSVHECTILISYHEALVNVSMGYIKKRLQVFLNSQTRSSLSH